MPTLFKRILLTILLVIVTASLWVASRPDMSEVGIPYAETAPENSGLRVRWLGVTTLLFDDGETQIMTDGFVSRPSALDLLLKRPIAPDIEAITDAIDGQKINRLAAIMPVHSHYDHAMDTADFARMTGADILGSLSTANVARSSSVPEAQIKIVTIGEPYSYGRFTITFYPSKHAPLSTNLGISGSVEEPFTLPAPYTAWQEGQSYSIHIEHPEGSALVQGSAGYIPGTLSGISVDTVFLGTGGLIDMTPDYVSAYVDETVHALAPSQVYIIHQDDLLGEFGNVEQNKINLSFDQTFAINLLQSVLPARLMQMPFGVDVSLTDVPIEKNNIVIK